VLPHDPGPSASPGDEELCHPLLGWTRDALSSPHPRPPPPLPPPPLSYLCVPPHPPSLSLPFLSPIRSSRTAPASPLP
jgi:hypothetical protein